MAARAVVWLLPFRLVIHQRRVAPTWFESLWKTLIATIELGKRQRAPLSGVRLPESHIAEAINRENAVYLQDVTLDVCGMQDKATRLKMMAATTHVEDIFRAFLPRKYDLHGRGKIIIELGKDTSQREYHEALNFGFLRRPDFVLEEFLRLPQDQQEAAALRYIESSLVSLAQRFGCDPAPLRAAAEKTRQTGFRLQRRSRVSKMHPSRRIKAEVTLTFRHGGVDVDLEIVKKKSAPLYHERLAEGEYWPTVHFNYWTGKWADQKFLIRGRTEKVTYEKDFGAFLKP